jgi:hypothetical protein
VLSLPPVSCPFRFGQSYVTLLLLARASLKQTRRLELAFGNEGSSHVILRFYTVVG